jgi:hypothetical protein
MTEPRPSQVLGGLPRSRPHRRSQRRQAVQPIPQSAPPRATMAGESTAKTGVPTLESKISVAKPETRSGEPRASAATPRTPAGEPRARTSAAKPKTRSTTAVDPKPTVTVSGETPGSAAPNGADPVTAGPARTSQAARATGTEVLGTAVQAAAELAEIGLTFWARTLRDAVSRLPHP